MIILSFLIGGMAGTLGMALIAGQAYEKGFADAKREDKNE